MGFLTLYCGDRHAAEELAQEALARAWRKWNRVSRLEDPAGWTRRVAINLANSRFRRLAAERRAAQRLSQERHVRDQPDRADTVAVREAVSKLPRRQRAALILHYYLDLPYAAVASIMDIPEATARSHVRRALARLKGLEGFSLSGVTDVN